MEVPGTEVCGGEKSTKIGNVMVLTFFACK